MEASLKRLQTDYIDLYWVHLWDGITPVEEVMRGLDDIVRQGKVLYVGISDAPAWWIAQANTLAELRGWTKFIGLQIEYSLMERTVERELVPMAKALNLGVVAWSPLAGGVLSGKYHGEGKAEGGRMTIEGLKDFLPEEQSVAPIISAVKSVSEQTGRSMAQVALAWLRRQTAPVIPIIGARRVSQLQDNLASLDLELSAAQLKSLDGASRMELGFQFATLFNLSKNSSKRVKFLRFLFNQLQHIFSHPLKNKFFICTLFQKTAGLPPPSAQLLKLHLNCGTIFPAPFSLFSIPFSLPHSSQFGSCPSRSLPEP